MRFSIKRTSYNLVLIALAIALVLVIWQPVLPSGLIIQGLASQIDPADLSADESAVLRFELAGRGGGNYNLKLAREGVEVTEGDTDRADLILAMNASDFNQLMWLLARGRADESVFARLVISNVLRVAGDMSVLQLVDPTHGGTQ